MTIHKTDWQDDEVVYPEDLNRIENNNKENTEQLLNIEKKVDDKINDFEIATEEMLIEAKNEVKKECSILNKKVAFLIEELPSVPTTYELNTTDTDWKSFEFDRNHNTAPNVTGTIFNDERIENLMIKNITEKGFIYKNSFPGIINIKIEEV